MLAELLIRQWESQCKSRRSHVFNRLPTVVDCGWEDIFRSHSVIDVDDHDANLLADASAPGRFGPQTPKDPPAWMRVVRSSRMELRES